MKLFEEIKSGFVIKSCGSTDSIELVESFEITEEFFKCVCTPYFTDLHNVLLLKHIRVSVLSLINQKKE